ncbi:MAG: fibronectin type III domain-containing protein [Euryarchaeota archaeon]|nr:fibronectin type III domain-containing protein [Euryarchaeota archaeon]
MQKMKLRASAVAWLLMVPLFMGLLFVGGASAIDPPILDETSWTKGIIDQTSDAKNVISQAIDDDGNLYVSYFDNNEKNLMFATNAGGKWIEEVVANEGIVGQYSSIAVDDDGRAHITYFDYSNNCLQYAVKAANGWTVTTVGDDGNVGKFNSLVLDRAGNAHIIYLDDIDDQLMYANNIDGSWNITVVDTFDVYATALTISDEGQLHAAYVGQNGKVNHAYRNNDVWLTEEIDNATGISPGVDIDIIGTRVCIAYSSQSKELKFAVRDGANDWRTEVVDNTTHTVSWVSMDVDSYDRVHITYYANSNLNYALNDGGWHLSILDTNCGICNSIISDLNDKQHVIYLKPIDVSNALSYMTNAEARWVSEVVDEGGEFDKVSSIAVDSEGNVHIAFFDDYEVNNVTYGQLCYANNVNGWTVVTADNSSPKVGMNPSLALDSKGWVHISYYDATGRRILKYINNVGGNWSIPVLLDQSENSGMYSSLAIDANDSVHVAYLKQGAKDLMYTTNAGGFWDPDLIDDSGTVSGRVSLALDPQGVPHVAYYRDDGLAYAEQNGTAWNITLLDPNNELGGGVSLFIDGQDRSYITYYNEISNLLKYINNTGGEWNATVIASEGIDGVDSVISVDADGEEHIAFVEGSGSGSLNYAERRSGIWMFQKVDVDLCGENISMVMDRQGRAHVSYFDPESKDLRYTTVVSVPSAPTNLTVNSEDGYLELSWERPINDGGTNITEYRIYRSNVSGGPYRLLGSVDANMTTYTDMGLTNGVTFYYRVKAVSSEGTSPYSDEVPGTPCVLPGAPDVKASGRDGAIVLDWDEPDNGGAAILKYNIYRKNATGVYQLIASVDGDKTSFRDTGLENGVEYFYYVTAVNPAGEGPGSDPVSATPDAGMDTAVIIGIVIAVLAVIGVGAFLFLRQRNRV